MMANHTMMIVKWIDARKKSDTFIFPDEFIESRPCIIHTIGWGKQTKDGICLAMDYYPDDIERNVREGYRETCVIPKECILEVIKLHS